MPPRFWGRFREGDDKQVFDAVDGRLAGEGIPAGDGGILAVVAGDVADIAGAVSMLCKQYSNGHTVENFRVVDYSLLSQLEVGP
jgi:hypothetical protein